jgi:phage gp36-like protein
MAYVTRAEVQAKIPPPILIDALDDNGDGSEDAGIFDQLVANAATSVESYLAGLYTVPFTEPAPPKVRAAALIFCLELLYARRQVEMPKGLQTELDFWREHLAKVANREIPFEALMDKAFVPGAAITEDVSVNAQTT